MHASESTSEGADIENVNPRAVTAKHGGLPSSTLQPQAQAQALGPPTALADGPLLTDVKSTTTSTPVAVATPSPGVGAASKQPAVAAGATAAAAAQSVLPLASAPGATSNKPVVASHGLSETPVLSDTSPARVPSAASEVRTQAAASDATASKQANVLSADAGSSSGTDAPVPQATTATANKPFISSKALSDALFGSSDDSASPIRSHALHRDSQAPLQKPVPLLHQHQRRQQRQQVGAARGSWRVCPQNSQDSVGCRQRAPVGRNALKRP